MELLIISGNLGADPEMRFTPDGTPVTNFNLAVNRRYTKDDGTKVEETKWYRVAAWRRLAEVCNEYLEKGREVTVQGRLTGERVQSNNGGTIIQPRVWQGQDGEHRASFEVTALSIEFHGRGNGGAGAPAGGPPAESEEDEIPF